MDEPSSYAIRGLIKVAHVLLEGSKETRDAVNEVEESVNNAYEERQEIDSRINMVDDRVDELESSIESFDVEGCDGFQDLESRIDTLEHEDYGNLNLGDFQEFTDLALQVRDIGEEVELHEHRLGSLETKLNPDADEGIDALKRKLDGEVVSIKDLATRLNKVEHAISAGRPVTIKEAEADNKIVDAIQKLYELHGMEIDFSLVKKVNEETKEVDSE